MARLFVYDGREFADPDPELPVDKIRAHFATFFPELSNAETKESKRGEDQVFEFKKRVGTKGDALLEMKSRVERLARENELQAPQVVINKEVELCCKSALELFGELFPSRLTGG